MVINVWILVIWIMILPTMAGCLWTGRTPEDSGSVPAAYFYGLFTVLALFEFLAIPMVFLKGSLTVLTRVWGGLVLLLGVISLFRTRGFRDQRRWAKKAMGKLTPVLVIVFVCILLQMSYVTARQHIDDDDAFYLATATTSVEEDSLYRYNPYTGGKYKKPPARYVSAAWPLFLASMSKLSDIHPAILAHTVLPGIVVLWAYLAYAMLAGALFSGERRKQDIFLLFIVILLCFSGYSRFSSATVLFIRSWQGKAVVAGFGIPALAYSSWMAMKNKAHGRSWVLLGAAVTGVCLFSTMGAAISVLLVGSCGAAGAVLERKGIFCLYSALACLPAAACGMIYYFLR